MKTHTFLIPANLNGEQLREELNAEMVYINEDLLYVVGELTESQAKAGIAAHVPVMPKEPTLDEKLASVGLSVADLKEALGL